MAVFEPDIRTSRGEGLASALIAGWIRLCRRTIRWTRRGDDELLAGVARGPVLFVFWHSRLVMASALVPPEALPLVNLFAVNRDGRISAGVQSRFGLRPIGLSGKGGEHAAARAALTALRSGHSLAVPGDNSRTGARRLAPAPLDWARVSEPMLGTPRGIALAAGAPAPNAGKLFIDFWLGQESSEILANQVGEYVLAPGVYPPIPGIDGATVLPLRTMSDEEIAEWGERFGEIFR